MDSVSHLVIGAGIAGASTAWHLARRGHEVLLLERDRPASARGSSHGSARIFRYPYANPLYTGLVQRAAPLWEELSAIGGEPLISRTGGLDHGDLVPATVLSRVLAQQGIPHEVFEAEAARERWPQFRFDTEVLHQPDAGVLDAERTVRAMVRAAQNHGAELRTGWTVEAVERVEGGYLVHSGVGEPVHATRVVVAAGGWLPELLPKLPLSDAFRAGLPAFEVTQEEAFHFPYAAAFADANWPTVIRQDRSSRSYALPGGRDAGFRGLKIAEYHAGRPLASAAKQDGRISDTARHAMIERIASEYPGLDPEPYAETTCLFTMTPSEDFVIDGDDGITILSACSGHGAKFAPLLGALVADELDGGPRVPDEFRVGRRGARR
ncbi:sarcosine oxidase [Leucobacter sp. OLJS4]|uniref:FAD-dependent oxidoreductase n=1 Tax=unclassified Leucobacter TaxID=2621730 RepID=UPI000C18181F|nr:MULTISPECIES: FAD-dependent oxidoreductase [unclassified Leucobacter]PII81586.1 sarcosine oxidase [Leucobacter sp. OLCALW19]PII86258.1 sarcosine oxidase [Leucobacter sp. OLTLW20]PII90153.1 sarcosine oxidase [Leucobacter sp. OLAS13]PII97186.1 sarcosine oxidase [Leucobacter sp. OLDS2]PII99998.1 sarcosine oxidase [Leucobacter sp. OLCS4]